MQSIYRTIKKIGNTNENKQEGNLVAIAKARHKYFKKAWQYFLNKIKDKNHSDHIENHSSKFYIEGFLKHYDTDTNLGFQSQKSKLNLLISLTFIRITKLKWNRYRSCRKQNYKWNQWDEAHQPIQHFVRKSANNRACNR